MKNRVLKTFSGFILLPTLAAANPSNNDQTAFEQYQAQELQSFNNYITDQQQAFEVYKQAYTEALQDYKKNISSNWSSPEVSTPRKWVSYQDDFKQKTSVDFETGQVTISKVVPKDKPSEQVKQELQTELEDLSKLTYQKAYEQDPVAVKVDQVVQQKVSPKMVETHKPSTKPVPIFSEKPQPQKAKVVTQQQDNQKVVTLTYQLKEKDVNKRVKAVLPFVLEQSQKRQVPPALVLALIKNESSYNPLAKSHIPAYGLMQVVPGSAGIDSTRFLFGRAKLLSSSYLYTPDKNIEVGTAYIHILNYRYLKHIKDPQSRMYCTIAAYNTGAGNVARSFIGNNNIKKASRVINAKSPQQVYNHLIRNLPYDETRRYLKKVNRSYQQYQQLFTQS